MNQLKKVLGESFFLPITFKVFSISNWSLVKWLKFMFSRVYKKLRNLHHTPSILCLLSKCQIDGEDFVIFCGLLRKHELYMVVCTCKILVNLGQNMTEQQLRLTLNWLQKRPNEKSFTSPLWLTILFSEWMIVLTELTLDAVDLSAG